MDYESFLQELRSLVRNALGDEFAHGYPHIVRVEKYAEVIVEMEGIDVDWFLLRTSILLHDIGRILGEPHAYYSSIIARGLLEEKGFDRGFIDRVVNAILVHSYSYTRRHNVKPKTIEAMVLSDADKLDALGVIGFSRVISYSTLHGRSLKDSIKHIDEKLLGLRNLLYFEASRRIAEEKTKILLEVRNLLESELKQLFGQH